MSAQRGVDAFAREPLRPFLDLRKEDFCRARAQGKNPTEASEEAGIDRNTGMRWGKHDAIIARIREIRQSTEGFTEVSAAYVLEELKVTIMEARDAGQFQAAVNGLKALHEIIAKDKTGMRAAALGVTALGSSPSRMRRALLEDLSKPEALPAPKDAIDVEPDDEGA